MKKGKYSVSSFAKLKGKRRMVAALALALILVCTVGGTLAYVFMDTDPVENTFTPSAVATAVVENFQNKIKSDVKIQNVGDTDAFIRASVVVTWKNEVGNVWAKKPVEGTDYSIEWNLTDDGWAKGADGYYYFEDAVAPNGGMTQILINEVKLMDGVIGPKGTDGTQYYLSVEIVASGIQSTGIPNGTSAQDAWAKAPGNN